MGGGFVVDMPGSAGLVMVSGVVHLDPEAAVFEAMLTGWARQQRSRLLGEKTIADRLRLVRRFADFAESYPWTWGPGDVEDFTVSLTSGRDRRSPSTIRGYHLSLRMFGDYVTDARYEWPRVCRDRFDQVPAQVCHEWNTVAHLNAYEGRPGRRPLTYTELEQLSCLAYRGDAASICVTELTRVSMSSWAARSSGTRVGHCPARRTSRSGQPRCHPDKRDKTHVLGIRLTAVASYAWRSGRGASCWGR
jgi:hypothetical protein